MRGLNDLPLSPRVRDLAVSPTIAIQQRSAALLREGRRIHRLGLGQSPLDTAEVDHG